MKIKLGSKVRCKITGFVGTAVARTEFINGCVQYLIVSKVGKDNKYPESDASIDETSLEVIEEKPKKTIKKKSTGGAVKKDISMRGF